MYCDFIVSEAFRSKGFKLHLTNCDLYYCDLRLFCGFTDYDYLHLE